MRSRVFLFLVFLVGAAHADLYRWVDPETGSVKFSTYPPPWYGDEAKQRRAPPVERIPTGRDPAKQQPDLASAGKQEPGKNLEALEAQRKALLQQMPGAAARGGPAGGVPALQKQLEALSALSQQIDKLNPEGANARRAEAEAVLQNLIKGLPR